MKYFRLYDFLSPVGGDLYRVDPKTGEAWMVTDSDEEPISAFAMAAKFAGTTQFHQLMDYASKNGTIEEVECPVS